SSEATEPLPAPTAIIGASQSGPAPPTGRRALVIPTGIPDTLLRSDGYANARHQWHCSSALWCKGGTDNPGIRDRFPRQNFFIDAGGACTDLTLYLHQDHF